MCRMSFYNSIFLPFSLSSVMILLAFFLVSLFFFSFIKDQNNSFFSINANHCVFEPSVLCVYLFHCVIATEFDYGITTSSELYCMQLIV